MTRDEFFEKIWRSKEAHRLKMAALTFTEKVQILERMREDAAIIKASAIKAGLRKPDLQP